MKKKMIVVSLAALMVLVMASVSFAATETAEGRQFFRGFGRQGGFQFIMDKLGLTEEEALDLKNSDKTMMEIAEEKGLDVNQWHEKMQEAKNQRFNDLVEAGKITAEEAAEFKALMEERFKNCVEGEGFGLGRQLFKGLDRQGGLQFIMDKLELTEEEVLDLKNGDKTMMEIAEEKGLDVNQWHEEMQEAKNQRIDNLVEAGIITADEAEEFKALMAEGFENSSEGEGFGLGRGMMGRGFGKRMMGRGLKGW